MRHQLARFALANPASASPLPIIRLAPNQTRCLSTSTKKDAPTTAPLRLSDLRSRIGKCINFGLDSAQAHKASSLLQDMTQDWRGLIAGTEGFLTEENRMGLYRQAVVWGEMVIPPVTINRSGTQKLIRNWGNRTAW